MELERGASPECVFDLDNDHLRREWREKRRWPKKTEETKKGRALREKRKMKNKSEDGDRGVFV